MAERLYSLKSLFDGSHYLSVARGLWVLLWCLDNADQTGAVLGGDWLKLKHIAAATGMNDVPYVHRQVRRLERLGYLEVLETHPRNGTRLRVLPLPTVIPPAPVGP